MRATSWGGLNPRRKGLKGRTRHQVVPAHATEGTVFLSECCKWVMALGVLFPADVPAVIAASASSHSAHLLSGLRVRSPARPPRAESTGRRRFPGVGGLGAASRSPGLACLLEKAALGARGQGPLTCRHLSGALFHLQGRLWLCGLWVSQPPSLS